MKGKKEVDHARRGQVQDKRILLLLDAQRSGKALAGAWGRVSDAVGDVADCRRSAARA